MSKTDLKPLRDLIVQESTAAGFIFVPTDFKVIQAGGKVV